MTLIRPQSVPLTVCSANHEQICYTGQRCPFCKYIGDKETEIALIVAGAQKMTEEIQ